MKKKLLLTSMLLAMASILFSPSLYAISVETKGAHGTSAHPGDAVMENAFKDFKSLSKQERKERVKDAKTELKQYKKDKKAGKAEPSTNTLLLVILAILLPPLAVFLHEGEINSKFWIDLVLTLLFYLPGLIYALIVIFGKD